MPTSKIYPPYNELQHLAQPLTKGEWRFLDWLRNNLTSDWEIYVQPYMNGLRPDFVLLSPEKGMAVYEVKDWDLSAVRYWYAGDPPVLKGKKDGVPFKLRGDSDPVVKIKTYKSEIFNLYCPSLHGERSFGAIVGGIVFPFASTASVKDLLAPAFKHHELHSHPRHNVIVGSDLLDENLSGGQERKVLPSIYTLNQEMTAEAADDLRHWLMEPEPPKDQRRNAFDELDPKQRAIVVERPERGWRRIQGPAGSGKTLVLCGRTARLVAEGKHVLLITFNITLINYLRDTVARFFAGTNTSRSAIARQYEIMNFHYFCSRLAEKTGHKWNYQTLWREAYGNALHDAPEDLSQDKLERLLSIKLPVAAREWAAELTEEQKYDAIFVDEAQDLRPEWWEVLISTLKEGGEALIAADRTQNVYSVDQTWVNAPTKGFRGRWMELKASYRLPPEITREATRFIHRFLPESASIVPEVPLATTGLFSEGDLTHLAQLRWVETPATLEGKIAACLQAIDNMVQSSSSSTNPLNYADVTFLVENEKVGVALRRALLSRHIRVIDTFASDTVEARRKKMAFYLGDGRVKITTVFSYKGWETRALILQIGHGRTEKDHALFYTGLTRVKVVRPHAYLTVINSAPEYTHFGQAWNREKSSNLY